MQPKQLIPLLLFFRAHQLDHHRDPEGKCEDQRADEGQALLQHQHEFLLLQGLFVADLDGHSRHPSSDLILQFVQICPFIDAHHQRRTAGNALLGKQSSQFILRDLDRRPLNDTGMGKIHRRQYVSSGHFHLYRHFLLAFQGSRDLYIADMPIRDHDQIIMAHDRTFPICADFSCTFDMLQQLDLRIREQGGVVHKGDIRDRLFGIAQDQIQLLLQLRMPFIDVHRPKQRADHAEQGHDQDHQRNADHLAHAARPPGAYAVKHRRYGLFTEGRLQTCLLLAVSAHLLMHEMPLPDEADFIRDLTHEVVMRCDHHDLAAGYRCFFQQLQEETGIFFVQCRGRLITDDQLRAFLQDAQQRKALTLSPGKRFDPFVQIHIEAEHPHGLFRFLPVICSSRQGAYAFQVFLQRQPGVDHFQILHHIADLRPSQLCLLLFAQGADLYAVPLIYQRLPAAVQGDLV